MLQSAPELKPCPLLELHEPTAMRLIDSHAHTDATAYDADREAMFERAREVGIEAIVSIGIDVDSCRRTLALSRTHPFVFAALGIHPNSADVTDETWDAFLEVFESAADEIVAVGETGLDTYRDSCPFDVQERRFRDQLALARRHELPVIIHCRDAYDPLIDVLVDEDFRHGVIHCFGGTTEHAQTLLDHGFHLSFAGNVTYKTAESLRAAARLVPIERLLLETDAPFLAPIPERGNRNEPAFVRHTADVLADCLGTTPSELAEATTANAIRLFRLPLD